MGNWSQGKPSSQKGREDREQLAGGWLRSLRLEQTGGRSPLTSPGPTDLSGHGYSNKDIHARSRDLGTESGSSTSPRENNGIAFPGEQLPVQSTHQYRPPVVGDKVS